MTIDYQIRLLPFPASVKEAVSHNEDDSYTIFINENLSSEGRKAAFYHALKHIAYDDFALTCVQDIEYVAHLS